uniref:glutathione dehydrogenase (ascorbate) n=1 Tax=Ditylum brightwellii TaxID=49249 RepID=A0A6U3NUI9_9STRA|mmetsp:Transcript_12108/g.18085  ORF Transcript_12108/g.18085 Transcript_12108/m.18085 type:complete len:222 (+) Transcript_12108:139-804(+)
MTLYIKAGPDGKSVGDCPFAHYVRIVLHEKGLEYDVRPSTQDTKPQWLIDYYEGSMPALRHRKECYTESDVIAQYLDFFFQEPPLSGKKKLMAATQEAIDGFFPAVAKYLKHTPDGDDDDAALKQNLEGVLGRIEQHLSEKSGPFLVGDGAEFTLADASLAPKLFHMQVGLQKFKDNAINVSEQFPAVQEYMTAIFDRPSFKETLYPEETVVWGWSNAREN